jgi:hypothetical protein
MVKMICPKLELNVHICQSGSTPLVKQIDVLNCKKFSCVVIQTLKRNEIAYRNVA